MKTHFWRRLWACLVAGILLLAGSGRLGLAAAAEDAVPIMPNRSANDYTVYADIVTSYLVENGDGSLSRIEAAGADVGVVVESYAVTSDPGKPGSLSLNSRTIPYELPIFGGYYEGKDDHFLVFGQENPEESDSCEVIRVVKYSRDWVRKDSCSIYGANTAVPFTAGSLRMAELDGSLFLHTCHTMYAMEDGSYHQANMSLEIAINSMTLTDYLYDVRNISVGYVSHSFNQFIVANGRSVYRLDHGDAYPRAITVTKFRSRDSLTDVEFAQVISIPGQVGANETGVSIGGFGLSEQNCIIAGNAVALDEPDAYDAAGQHNIFLTITDQDLGQSATTLWLTSYTAADGIVPRTPQLVRLDKNAFLVLWEEEYTDSGFVVTRLATIDGAGQLTSDIATTLYQLSDCQPIVTTDGMVKWYVNGAVGDEVATTLYSVDPDDLEVLNTLDKGDLDADGAVSIQDAYQTLMAYANAAAGLPVRLAELQQKAADVDEDGKITIQDTYRILVYYATEAAGGQASWT